MPLAPAAPHSGPTASCWPLAAGAEWGGATVTACALRCLAGPARARVMGAAAARATEIESGTWLPSGWWTSTRFHTSSPPPLGALSAELGERPPQRREDNPRSGPPPLQAHELAAERPQHGGQGVPRAHDAARGAQHLPEGIRRCCDGVESGIKLVPLDALLLRIGHVAEVAHRIGGAYLVVHRTAARSNQGSAPPAGDSPARSSVAATSALARWPIQRRGGLHVDPVDSGDTGVETSL